jgi:DNA-binding CsgD family transcriptional regulator
MGRAPPLTPRELDAFRLDDELVVLVLGDDGPHADPRLTPAERDLVARCAEGASNAEIAKARGTSVRTVANQMARLIEKVGATSRVDLVARLARGT